MHKEEQRERFIDIMAGFTAYIGKYLPDDVLARLQELREKEEASLARIVYEAMFDDLQMAKELDRPCCQDTGVIQYFVQVGTRFPLIDEIEVCLQEAVKKATLIGPLRHNAVEVFDEKNTEIMWVPECRGLTGKLSPTVMKSKSMYIWPEGAAVFPEQQRS
jgi:L(+)-tartrate dehydratase alpha subunit